MNVLVVDLLESFLASTEIPVNVRVTTFSEDSGPPSGDYVGIIPVVTTRMDSQAIAKLPDLRIIANYGVGYDNIDVAAAHERGIAVTNTPGVLTDATAELTWALILATARRLGEGERLVRSGEWSGWQPTQLRGTALTGKNLAIIGAGRIGRAVGEKAGAFGMTVRYWTRHDDLDDILRHADVVSIHLSKSRATERLIDARRLALLRDGAILINTARGAIVDEAALIRELQSGRISAGLDVYVNEPRVPKELLDLDNVVLLPHLGSATTEARQAMWYLAWKNLCAGIEGRPLPNPVTPTPHA